MYTHTSFILFFFQKCKETINQPPDTNCLEAVILKEYHYIDHSESTGPQAMYQNH